MSSAVQGQGTGLRQPKHRAGNMAGVKKPAREVPACRGPPVLFFGFILQAVENKRVFMGWGWEQITGKVIFHIDGRG